VVGQLGPSLALDDLQGGGEGLHLVKVRYLILHDLEVTGAANNGINCDDGGGVANPDATRFVIFRRLNIHDIGGSGNQDGLKLSGYIQTNRLNQFLLTKLPVDVTLKGICKIWHCSYLLKLYIYI